MDGVADIDSEVLGAARNDAGGDGRGRGGGGRRRRGGGAVLTASCLWVQAPSSNAADKAANFNVLENCHHGNGSPEKVKAAAGA